MTDILIAGGGPAGLAAAIALAERGVCVVVVDVTGGISLSRGELLSHGALDILKRLGLENILKTACPIEDVVSQWGMAKLQAHGGEPSLGLHGWGINRQTLSQAMLHRVQMLGAPVLTGRIRAHKKTADGWQINLNGLSGVETMHANYLIDATGRPASLARRSGATLLQGSDLVAVTWQIANTGPAKMLSEATPHGWWYAVPHPSGRTLGYITTAQRAQEAHSMPADFLSAAQDDLNLISVAGASTEAQLMNSRCALLSRMSGPGWLAVGDAAAAFDPIASQGLFNALSGGFFAGNAAADAIAGDRDAPLVYEAIATRTAERTFAMMHLQYAALPFDTQFWRQRAHLSIEKARAAS